MSLTISTNPLSASLIANAGTLSLMSVAQVTENIRGDFLSLASEAQVHTLGSACRYLEAVGEEADTLANCRAFLANREAQAEPGLFQLSTFRLVWSRNLPKVREKFPEPDEAPSSPLLPPSDAFVPPEKVPTPLPPVPPARVAAPLFVPVAPAPAVSAAADENEDDQRLYPALWWDLSKATRLGLKSAALGNAGRAVNEQTMNDEAHAQFLGSALATWMGDILSGGPSRGAIDRLAMVVELLGFFRRSDRLASPLGRIFWDRLSENKDVRLAVNRLSVSRFQAAFEDEPRARLDQAIRDWGLGVVESLVMPLYEGMLPPNAADAAQGEKAAKDLMRTLDALPMTVKTDLNADETAALKAADETLRVAGQKMRGDAQSAYAAAFIRELGVYGSRLSALAEMIRQKLRHRAEVPVQELS